MRGRVRAGKREPTQNLLQAEVPGRQAVQWWRRKVGVPYKDRTPEAGGIASRGRQARSLPE